MIHVKRKKEWKKTQYTKYDTAAIKEAADVFMVAQAIGMDMQHNRHYKNRVSVLCPSHDDKNHGNCFLTERGCHCFACGESFDVFDMVRLQLNLEFKEAAEYVADLCGGRKRFVIDGDGEPDGINRQNGLKMISSDDMKLINIHNTPVYTTYKVVNAFCRPERQPGFRYNWYPGNLDKGEEDYIVIEKMVIRNPLLELFKSNPQGYKELIRNKALETLERYHELRNIFTQVSKDMAKAVDQKIRYIEKILVEHGGSLCKRAELVEKRAA